MSFVGFFSGIYGTKSEKPNNEDDKNPHDVNLRMPNNIIGQMQSSNEEEDDDTFYDTVEYLEPTLSASGEGDSEEEPAADRVDEIPESAVDSQEEPEADRVDEIHESDVDSQSLHTRKYSQNPDKEDTTKFTQTFNFETRGDKDIEISGGSIKIFKSAPPKNKTVANRKTIPKKPTRKPTSNLSGSKAAKKAKK